MPEVPCESSAEAFPAFSSTSIKEVQVLRGIAGSAEVPS